MEHLQIIQTSFEVQKECEDLLNLLSEYATDLAGGGSDLPEAVKKRLIPELRQRQDVTALLAYQDDEAVGLALAFEGFSTFYARPLLNIHDFVVKKEYRGKGIAKRLLGEMENIAIRRGCCKLTLEVLEGNHRAQKVYRNFGFSGYELDSRMGQALFWHKTLN